MILRKFGKRWDLDEHKDCSDIQSGSLFGILANTLGNVFILANTCVRSRLSGGLDEFEERSREPNRSYAEIGKGRRHGGISLHDKCSSLARRA